MIKRVNVIQLSLQYLKVPKLLQLPITSGFFIIFDL